MMKTAAAAALIAATLAGCGGSQDEQVRRENELADWGEQIEIELRSTQDGNPCTYTVSNVRVGFGLRLTADVTARCPDDS